MKCKCFCNTLPESLPFKEKFKLAKCTCNARYVVIENKAKFSIEPTDNLNCIDKIKVDNYLITSKVMKKCDYLFVYKAESVFEEEFFIFVELKGSDFNTGVDQLKETIMKFYNERLINFKKNVRAALVSNYCPKNTGTSRNRKRELEKIFKTYFKSFKFDSLGLHMIYDYAIDKFKKG